MRVVFSCVPQAGHIMPMLPLAEALRAQGDEVVFASGDDTDAVVSARGFACRRAGPAFGEWYAVLRSRIRGVPGDGLAPQRVERYFLPRLFGEVGTALMIDDLVAVGRELAPDMLVFDPLVFAGPLAAAVLGVSGVQHTVGPLVDAEVSDLVADAVSPIWREFGLDVPPAAGVYEGTTIAICPASLDPAGATLPRAQPLRPSPLPSRSGSDDIVLPAGDEPLVYITLGTFSNNPALFRILLDALADEPIRMFVTTGTDVDPATIRPIPANATVERFVPQARLLPHCAAAVHHAGAGTTFGILAHGLPAVALPQSADNFVIAQRLDAAGAAVTLMPSEVNAGAVRDALREVLTNGSYRIAAAQLAEEIAAMPGPEAVAAALRTP